ncbi:hypothetical protein ZIOFF_073601 [Zingiber officinale]|uniref:Uncharacterized protein n=1 Tax=Zingiber officinale TaxID=94328 RepID=A0A8J5BY17_ZINOF|nr:hypothetical protein ZIOFF_073601 [Zingiber officinale]
MSDPLPTDELALSADMASTVNGPLIDSLPNALLLAIKPPKSSSSLHITILILFTAILGLVRKKMFPCTISYPPLRHHLSPRFLVIGRRHHHHRPRFTSSRVPAFGWNDNERLVDEDMIMAEASYEAPTEWADWEKRYYTSYHANVCEVLCLLQTVLMSTRPSFAIGIAVVMALSVPTSAVFISFHLVEALKAISLVGVMHLG